MYRVVASTLRRLVPGALLLALVAASTPSASATTLLTFNGSGYQDGSVLYSISGTTLTITLKNTAVYSATGKVAPSDILTGVIFTLPTGISLVPLTAVVAPGSSVIQTNTCTPGPCAGVTNVAGEFGYQAAPFSGSGAPTGPYNAGIGSSGQVAGNGTQFPGGVNLDDPVSMDGLNFGLVGANYVPSMGNKKVAGEPLIQNAVTFTLTIVGGTLLESQITNWALVFGTSWSEGIIPPDGVPDAPVPEPSSLVLLGGGLIGFAAVMRRRRRT